MLAMEITEAGGPDVLKAAQRPVPVPAPGDVLIHVQAAGVNRPDIMQREGKYPPPPGASDLPGLEVAGTVVATGDDVRQLRHGDNVCALVNGGGYAQYCTAPAVLCLPFPDNFDAIQAAALPETFYTVWTNVFDRGRLAAGERFLVHGGSSGIGTTAIQLANAFGATVFATAGTKEKCDFCLELGAQFAINYREEDFAERIVALTDGAGVDVILDMVGGDYLSRNLKSLNDSGRLVQIAIQHGAKSELNLWSVMSKRLTITGSTLRPRSVAEKAAIAEALKTRVWPLLNAGSIKPVIHATFPLEQAAKAHALMESSAHLGKIILTF
ncbi:MAG: NAD(P)H-quinone oxidoreductase [Gammaproteobacteria bacterium]|nr:MAG: NAD(P)H-quinone oxidoreductase [Gammaproteobacteria bacterium]